MYISVDYSVLLAMTHDNLTNKYEIVSYASVLAFFGNYLYLVSTIIYYNLFSLYWQTFYGAC